MRLPGNCRLLLTIRKAGLARSTIFESGIRVPPEFPIGRFVPAMTWDAFQLKRQQYNTCMVSLFAAWQRNESSTQASDDKSVFRCVFDEIVETPLRPAYWHLNRGLFDWIWSS